MPCADRTGHCTRDCSYDVAGRSVLCEGDPFTRVFVTALRLKDKLDAARARIAELEARTP